VEHAGAVREITLRVIPVSDTVRAYLVLFEERQRGGGSDANGNAKSTVPDAESLALQVAQQRELAQMRDYLRKVVEQHEAATEELRAANEEARSSNEELQSTNEELRTAKEELQSSNEELTTVNDELKHRNEELRLATNDLSNVLGAVMIPIFMVGMDLRLRRFTPSAVRLLNFAASDIGQLITDLEYGFQAPKLNETILDVIQRLAVRQVRAQDRQGRWFEVFVRPYRTADDRIEGAVVAFIDVDESTRALEEAKLGRSFAEGIIESVQHPLLVLDPEMRVLRATAAFYRMFLVRREETEGRPVDELPGGQWKTPELRRLLDAALIRDVPFQDVDMELEFPDLGRRSLRLNARRIVGGDSRPHRLLLAIEDVTERREAAEIQYRRLFESAKDAIVILDAASGRVTDVNPFFTQLTRYTRAEVVGKPLWEVEVFLNTDVARRLIPETKKEEPIRFDTVPVRARDGRELILEMIANQYRVREALFIQINIRDVTERRQMEERLRRSNLDLQQFAFAASHDLQEPLRTVTSFSQLLKQRLDGHLDSQTEQHIAFIVSAADRMSQMVLDLLGYSQIARGGSKIEPVNAEVVLSTVILNLQMAIKSSNTRITFDHLPTVLMDQMQFLQLLQNLLSNGIKYRGPEPPRIHISARDAGSEWIFSVKDNGMGIDGKYTEQIFTVFKRLHGAQYPGTGIGLAICKKVVERHGGRIWVDSEPGKGSTFRFTIPKAPRADAEIVV
jgi:two-component system CheB/CheR fusion protein